MILIKLTGVLEDLVALVKINLGMKMKQYFIGTKQVLAEPFVKDGVIGYSVEYPDGYQSWSPANTFESAYLPQGSDAGRINQKMINYFILLHNSTRIGNTTVVRAALRNGTDLLADWAFVDSDNYDHELGEQMALDKIRGEVWRLLEFALSLARNGIKCY